MNFLTNKGISGSFLFILATLVALFRDVYFVNEFFNKNTFSMDAYFTSMMLLALIINFIFAPFQEYFNYNKKILKNINIKLLANLYSIGFTIFLMMGLYLFINDVSDDYIYIKLANLFMLTINFPLVYLHSLLFESKRMHLISGSNLFFSTSLLMIIFILSTSMNINHPILTISISNLIIQFSIFLFFVRTLSKSGYKIVNQPNDFSLLSFFSKKIFLLVSFNALIFCPFYIFSFLNFFTNEGNITAFSLAIKPFLIFQVFITFVINGIFFNNLFNKEIEDYTKIFNINFNKIFNGVIVLTLIILGLSYLFIPTILEFITVPKVLKLLIIEVYFLSIILLPIIFMNVLFLKLLTLNFFGKYLYYFLYFLIILFITLFLGLIEINSASDYLSFIFVMNLALLFLLLLTAFFHKIFSLYSFIIIIICIFLFLSSILTYLYELYFGTFLFFFLYLSLLITTNYLNGEFKLNT